MATVFTEDKMHSLVPEELAAILEHAIWLTCSDVDIAAYKLDLEEKIKVAERRLHKLIDQKHHTVRNQRGKQGSSYSGRNSTHDVYTKINKLRHEFEALEREYGTLVAIESKVPLDFVLTSRIYRKDEATHFLLGYYDQEIGPNRHGHMVVNKDGKCAYLRLPFENHGPANAFTPATSAIHAVAEKFKSKSQDA